MQSVTVVRWAAWAPGLEDRAAWERWCQFPRILGVDGTPDVAFLPPLLRRRCGRLSRMMLKAAFACGTVDDLARVPTVFASRHGDTGATVALLECLARDEPLSANRFSHSVHNTQAGLFSIVAGNRAPASALAAGGDTFGCAFLEAIGAVSGTDRGRVLLVVADEPLPPVLAPFVDEPSAAYAVALLLDAAAEPGSIALEIGRGDDPTTLPVAPAWPSAVEFLRWSLSAEPVLRLASRQLCWTWRRI